MRSVQYLASAIALASNVYAQVDSKVVCDSSTKLCLSSYTATEQKITFGIALPMNVSDPNGYDAIISITSPIANTWAGFCWGGTMVFNPLTVGWPNAKTATVSSRFAFGLTLPQPYDGADYTLLKGTVTNATHWTMVARCKGCTMWQANDGNNYVLNGTGVVPFAFAQGDVAVSEPANNQSAFNVHHSFGKWNHDLGAARIANFDAYVAANILPPAVVSTSTSNTATATTTSKSTLITSTVKPTSTATGKGKIPATCSGVSAPKYTSVLAAGWKATKVAAGLTSPRSIVFDSLGNMLVVQSGKGISVHVMAGDGCVSSTKMLISLNSLNHGIQFSADGKTLYASTMTNVYSWPYTASTQTVGTRATIITGMYNGGHSTRTLLIAPHQPNLLLVSHGSNDNWDYASGNPKVGRSIIKVFDLNAIPSAGYNYVSQGWTAGYGMRNEVGIAFDGNNMLWGVENSGDDFKRKPNGGTQFDVHTDNPAEKLNYIGDITKENTKWFGYPTCFAVWKPSAFTDAKFQVGDQFVVSPNGTFKDDNCKGLATPPALTFQAHSAPIDAKFDADYSNLYVTFHGSWNRSPTTGFKLVVVPFKKGTDGAYTPVAPPTSDKGYTDIFANPNVEKCAGNGPSMSSGCSRPTGLAWDSQGRLYMTSDVTSDAEIFVLGKA